MTERTYLTTTFKEKDRVKALGARWDADVGKWYVPAGLDLVPFSAWLPASIQADALLESPKQSSARDVDTLVKGVPLSRLLNGVAAIVAKTFSEGVWTTAEVLKASFNKGHCYLELSERGPTGEVLAQARAVIWARSAQTLLTEFKRVTGADLDAGIKVLLRAKPVFKSQYGFSLEVDGIDPSYTLGDLEARRRDIRERLKREGLFDRNRRLPAPWDFSSVMVVAPERAAGLGDFAKEAERLQAYRVCEFSYINSRFQGEGAAAEIADAITRGLETWSGSTLPNAVVVIRGGGSVSDLAWLNNYDLARCICECPVPVFTGIGHERDDTSLDEVAHRSFDTPSKVILGIEDVVRTRAREAQAFFEALQAHARSALAVGERQTRELHDGVERAARAVIEQAKSGCESALPLVQHHARLSLQQARGASREALVIVGSDARLQVGGARQAVPAAMLDIEARARSAVARARQSSESLLPLTVERATGALRDARRDVDDAMRDTLSSGVRLKDIRERVDATLPDVLQRAAVAARTARQTNDRTMAETAERSMLGLTASAERAEALFREIAGQGPQKTLKRGFAVVRSASGKAVTGTSGIQPGEAIQLDLHDGTLNATVDTATSKQDKGA